MAVKSKKRIANTAVRQTGQKYTGTSDSLVGRAQHTSQKTAIVNGTSRQISGG